MGAKFYHWCTAEERMKILFCTVLSITQPRYRLIYDQNFWKSVMWSLVSIIGDFDLLVLS